jgi:hypothetical protein
MLSDRDFVKQSLNIDLFFLRIMKEHAYFMEVSFPPKNADLQKEARTFINIFNDLLVKTIHLSAGVVGLKDDMLTKYTLNAEKASEFLTGAPIDRNITRLEMQLGHNQNHYQSNPMLVQNVYMLNCQIIEAVKGIVDFKTKVLNAVLECKLFTTNYPLLIDHIRREAEFFIDILIKLQNRKEDTIKDAIRQEAFWNRIMAEHSKFIRGLLDPSHEDLIGVANDFGNEFDELTEKALEALQRTNLIEEVTEESLDATERIKEFKEQAEQGLLNCEIRSITIPLLADHVVREANHYLELLKIYEEQI